MLILIKLHYFYMQTGMLLIRAAITARLMQIGGGAMFLAIRRDLVAVRCGLMVVIPSAYWATGLLWGLTISQ
jgi:hypothetical protein